MGEFNDMLRLLELSYPQRKEIVPCLIGPPGIGKTAAVERHAERLGVNVVKIIASRCVPSEIVGMTMPDPETQTMKIYDSHQIGRLEDGDVLFLDELLEADQMVLSALLTLIESRETASGRGLPDIQIVAATNETIPPEQLRGNIKQRFLFKRFESDAASISRHIERKTGVSVSSTLLTAAIRGEDRKNYNFITPRTLTKLTAWMKSTKPEERQELAGFIDEMFEADVGTELLHCVLREEPPAEKAKRVVSEITGDDWTDCTMKELREFIEGHPEMADQLKEMEA